MSFWASSNTRGSGAAPSAAGVIPENALLGRHAEQSRVAVQNPGLRLRRPPPPTPVVYARVWIKEVRTTRCVRGGCHDDRGLLLIVGCCRCCSSGALVVMLIHVCVCVCVCALNLFVLTPVV